MKGSKYGWLIWRALSVFSLLGAVYALLGWYVVDESGDVFRPGGKAREAFCCYLILGFLVGSISFSALGLRSWWSWNVVKRPEDKNQ